MCCSEEDRVKALLLFISMQRLHSYTTVDFEMQYPATTCSGLTETDSIHARQDKQLPLAHVALTSLAGK